MNSASYHLVYDAVQAGFHTWKFALAGMIFVAVGSSAFLIFRNGVTPHQRIFGRVAGPAFAVVGAFWTFGVCRDLYAEYTSLTAALQSQSYAVVEGFVTDFIPAGPGGHPSESWAVAGHHYEISSAVITSGFGQPGVVAAGQRVRIADVNGSIARLEIAR
jgi:hypothetical protein